jgi:hypothetical protein
VDSGSGGRGRNWLGGAGPRCPYTDDSWEGSSAVPKGGAKGEGRQHGSERCLEMIATMCD